MEDGEEKILRESKRRLTTFHNYIKAYAFEIGDQERILTRQHKLRSFQKIQTVPSQGSGFLDSLNRGSLTLKAMRELPVTENPDIAIPAAYWAPVLGYFAAQGIGRAVLIALNCSPPYSHEGFRSAAANSIVSPYLPAPFNMGCTAIQNGFPSMNNYGRDPSDIQAFKALSNPYYLEDKNLAIAKALSTTRKWLLEWKYSNERRKAGAGRRLSRLRKNEIDEHLHTTTVFDLLWRLRCRSNYENPDMFLYGFGEERDATEFYKNLLFVTEMLVECLRAIINAKTPSANPTWLTSRSP